MKFLKKSFLLILISVLLGVEVKTERLTNSLKNKLYLDIIQN